MHGSVTIFGAGEIGKALGKLLSQNGLVVNIYDKNSIVENLSDIIFLCVPTIAIAEVADKIKPLLKRENIVISVSKGLDSEGHATYQIMQNLFGNYSNSVVLGGPMIAEEIDKDLESSAMLAAHNIEVFNKVSEIFSSTKLSLDYTDDVIGVSLCGVLKNIYSIALGSIEGKKLGSNAKGRYVTQIVKEMGDLITYFGGKKETVYTLAGLGDLIATGFSVNSSNFQVGVDLAVFGKTDRKSEGLLALPLFIKKIEDINKYPVLKETANLVLNFSPVVEV